MISIKEQILREFGDHGADTLVRYFAQIEYTAFWCIRMLRTAARIDAVIPEGVEDVVVVQRDANRLYQVKTRDESQGPWTSAEVLPILCHQYHRRNAFPSRCCYHFVSNQMADNRTALRPGSYGALYRLKSLLDIKHDGQSLTPDEQAELGDLEGVLIPKIRETLLDQYQDGVDDVTALALLHDTWIETNCLELNYPNKSTECDTDNLAELEDAMSELFPGAPTGTMMQLRRTYERLIWLVLRKILTGKSLETRRIAYEDVLDCRAEVHASAADYPDLDAAPGRTVLDKKARLGGFDPTELPVFHRQKELAEWPIRQLMSLGMTDKLERLKLAILDLQSTCRHKVCREQGMGYGPGPTILSMLRSELAPLATRYFPDSRDVDEQFCQGILWKETDLCSVWWHELNSLR